MDYNQYNTNKPKFSGFSIAAMVCGIASLLCCCTGIGFVPGALALLFVFLNRRKGQDMDAFSVTGIVTGAVGLGLSLLISISALAMMEEPAFQKEMYDTFEETYGEDYADMLAELYDFDMNAIEDYEYWD